MNPRELESSLLSSRWERPDAALLISLVYGTLIAVVLTLLNYYVLVFRWQNVIGFLPAAIGSTLLMWGSNRLWHSTISKMLDDPFAPAAFISRIPFWYLAGGMGYLIGILVAIRLGMMTMYYVPARSLFHFGGIIACLAQVPVQTLTMHRVSILKRTASGQFHT